ncbi:unnamed protein product [Mytilus edulis]|uniref:RNase H type-1 domain-containing protein n=1 Tax=Mytilus edulis TaxID=6550 RepID=A0A8S3QN94_MYTED|nr:unnamed protein product [Mytilus edulis]
MIIITYLLSFYPQNCPQSKLQLEYANKKIKFEDLKFHQFVAGEMEIIVSCKSDKEKNGRLFLLKKISYYYELYDWKALLQFYAAWIRRVESGQNKWSDDTADIETPLLASSVRSRQNRTDIANFLEYGFPLSCEGSCSGLSEEKNHAGARSHPDDMRKYLKKECTYGSIIGPFFSNPFNTDMVISPLNSVPKKDTLDRRVILDLSFGVDGEDSVNSHISKDLYLAGCDVQEKAFDAYAILGEVLDNCGLEESVEKAAPPSTSMVFLGILFDTVSCTLSITKDRLEEILGLVKSWLQKEKCSLRDLQSLLGKLHFVSSCVRPGRLFVSRLLVWLRTFGGQNITKRVPKYIKLDLVWWSKFLDIYNGVSMMFLIDWSSPDCVLSCDSTLIVCGGICNGRYFHTVFPTFIRRQQLHINALELLCVMVCLKVWASVLKGSRIVIYCDNSSSVTVLNSGACRNTFMQSCLREICFLTASHEFQVKGRHLSGEANRIADMLSRWDMDPGVSTEFLKLARVNAWKEIELDDDLFHFTSPW